MAGVVAPFTGRPEVRRLAASWPRLDTAIDWILNQQILTKEQLAAKVDEAAKGVLGDVDVWAGSINDQLRRELSESISKGESREEWAARMDRASLSFTGNAEAIGRTWTHRAYNAGTREMLADDVVGELFPYWLYESTSDGRTRATHRAMADKVAHRSSPLAAEMSRLVDEYGCRCTLVPLTREDAVAHGIDDDTGWVEPEAETADNQDEPANSQPALDAEKAAAMVHPASSAIYQAIQQFSVNRDNAMDEYRAAKKKRDEKTLIEAGRRWYAAAEKVKEQKAVAAKVHTATRNAFVEAFRQTAAPIKLKVNASKSYKNNQEMKEGVQFVQSLLGNREFAAGNTPDGIAVKIVNTKRKRAQYSIERNQIEAGSELRAETTVHEIGHQIEQNPEVRKAARDFIDRRFAGNLQSPKSINSIVGHDIAENYEVTHGKDDFEKVFLAFGESPRWAAYKAAYAGKHYESGDTEIVSLGIELLYLDAATFAKTDPEWFELIVRILRGQ